MDAVLAAVYLAQIEALRATGPIIFVDPSTFVALAHKAEEPTVVVARGWRGRWTYLLPYRGLYWVAKGVTPALDLPPGTEIVSTKRIELPSL